MDERPFALQADRGASPGRPYAWHELAERHGGIVDLKGRKIRRVRFAHGRWTIDLGRWTQGESSMTRLHTRFRTRQPMYLTVLRDNAFYRLLKRMGMQDVAVPNPDIDRAYIVRTDRPSVIQSLLLDRVMTRSLLGLRKGRLEVVRVRRGLRRTDVSELRWLSPGILTDEDLLEHALALVRATIDALYRLGMAAEPIDGE